MKNKELESNTLFFNLFVVAFGSFNAFLKN